MLIYQYLVSSLNFMLSYCLCALCHRSVAVCIIVSANKTELECGPMPNLMVALPNIGGALCFGPTVADRQDMQTDRQDRTTVR